MNIKRSLSVFFHVVSMEIKADMQYKISWFFTILISPVQVLVTALLFRGIFEFNESQNIKGYTLTEMIWYYIVITLVFDLIWNNTHTRMSDKIISGNLTMDLLRPLSVMKLELASTVGERSAAFMLEFLPCFGLFLILFPPGFFTVFALLRFFVIIAGSFILYFQISFLIGLLAFKIKSGTTVTIVKNLIMPALGGISFPLEFLPEPVNAALSWLPFKYIFYWPIRVFLNMPETRSPVFILRILLIQAVFFLFFYILSVLSMKHVAREYCAAGG